MSDALKILQAKCGVKDDGSFGPNTARAIAKHYELSDKRGAHLLGQAHHESGGFKRTKEGLYYSTPERLMAVWPSRFKSVEDAMPYAKNPEALANNVYSNRMGNRISVYVNLQHRTGEDPKMWPTVSKFPLFPNTPMQQAAQPVVQQPQVTASNSIADDEIPF